MMKNITSLKKTLALLFLMILGHVAANAAGKVYVNDFTIAPNTEKELELNFDTDAADINLIEVDITLPDGLTFVDYGNNDYFHADDDRFPGAITSLNKATRHLMIAGTGINVQGTSGAVATFKVKAGGSSSLAATSVLSVSNAKVRHADKSYEEVEAGSAIVTRVDPSTAGHAMELYFNSSSAEMSAGETVEVEVNMANPETMITGLTAKVSVSEGLSILGVKAAERLSSITYNAETGVFAYQGTVVEGDNGTVVKLVIQAASDYSGAATVTLSNISAATLTSTGIEQDNLTLNVTVNSNAVSFAFSDSYVMMNPGDSKDIVVTMTSDIAFTMMEARLVLPEGITAEVKKGDRLKANPTYNATTGKIVSTVFNKEVTEGSLMVITLTANDAFTAAGQVQLNGIVLSTISSATYEPAAISLDVKPYDNATKAVADNIVKELQEALDALTEDAKNYDLDSEAQAIQEAIDNLKAEIETTYNNGTIDGDAISAKAEEIKNATDQLAAKIEESKAAERQQANDEAYARLKAELDALDNAISAATSTILEEAPNVGTPYIDQLLEMQKKVDAAREALEAANDAVELTAESTNGELPTQEEINAVVAAAKEAQSKFVMPGDIDENNSVDFDDFDAWILVFLMEDDAIEQVDLWDITREGNPEEYEKYKKYDVNGDGKFTVVDAQYIFNMALGIDMSSTEARVQANAATPVATMTTSATAMGNGVTRYSFTLEGDQAYTSFQMKVMMDEGMDISNENALAGDMTLKSNTVGNCHFLLGYSNNAQAINGQLLYIDVKGNGNVKFQNMALSTTNALSVSVSMGETTGINVVKEGQQNESTYDLNGKRLASTKKGLNIVRNINGSAKKVMVK